MLVLDIVESGPVCTVTRETYAKSRQQDSHWISGAETSQGNLYSCRHGKHFKLRSCLQGHRADLETAGIVSALNTEMCMQSHKPYRMGLLQQVHTAFTICPKTIISPMKPLPTS